MRTYVGIAAQVGVFIDQFVPVQKLLHAEVDVRPRVRIIAEAIAGVQVRVVVVELALHARSTLVIIIQIFVAAVEAYHCRVLPIQVHRLLVIQAYVRHDRGIQPFVFISDRFFIFSELETGRDASADFRARFPLEQVAIHPVIVKRGEVGSSVGSQGSAPHEEGIYHRYFVDQTQTGIEETLVLHRGDYLGEFIDFLVRQRPVQHLSLGEVLQNINRLPGVLHPLDTALAHP